MEHPKSDKHQHHHHHILPDSMAVIIGGTLLFLTAITVWVAGIDLGALNFLVAMVVATFKALLVCLFFMNLLYDRRENSVIFATSFLFLAIFIALTGTDLFFRGDVYVKGPLTAAAPAGASKFKKPWVSTSDLVAHGKELYAQQCVACHGAEGKGNGPAAASLVPPPRNFTQASGWKNGRKPSQVFKTLKEGIAGSAMSSFATLPADDRWALSHYVVSMGGPVDADTPEDLAKVGVDPTKESAGGAEEAPTIPVKVAMARMAEPEQAKLQARHAQMMAPQVGGPGAVIYRNRCLQCHGENARGGIKVQNMGVNPAAAVVTRPLTPELDSMRSFEAFQRLVIHGLPGNLMPGNGQLSGAEIREVYGFITSHGGR